MALRAAASPPAEPLDEEAVRIEQWLLEGRHGTMDWMERRFDKRTDPTKLVDGAETVISVLHNDYQPVGPPPRPPRRRAPDVPDAPSPTASHHRAVSDGC